MKEEGKYTTLPAHSELNMVFQPVGHAVLSAVADQLIERGLAFDEDRKIQPRAPLTQDGLDMLMKTVATGIRWQLSNAKVNLPDGYHIEQISMVENILEGFGEPRVLVSPSFVGVRFKGQQPLVDSVIAPLNGDIVTKEGLPTVRVKLSKGLRIGDVCEVLPDVSTSPYFMEPKNTRLV